MKYKKLHPYEVRRKVITRNFVCNDGCSFVNTWDGRCLHHKMRKTNLYLFYPILI